MAESKIRILDEQTINQIAAGEVIENATSVVKELVDNAIDAKATKVVVEIQGSGRQSIMVQDNGLGMSRNDALLCLERHATSKIRSPEDLWKISSMGFRGEALAAICSISHISLLTAQTDLPTNALLEGTSLSASSGKITSCTPTKTLGGTKVIVFDLFYNVPARKKFLKSPAKEAHDILKVVTLATLANPHIGFELVLNQKKELQLEPDSGYKERIKKVLGSHYYSTLLDVSFENGWFKLQGCIGLPEASRPNRLGQYLFINGRPVTSPIISAIVKEAYGSSIEEGRYPVFVLYFQIDQERVDINVHPQKKEVRISYEEELKSHLIAALSEALFSLSRKSIVPQAAMSVPFQSEEKHFEFPKSPFQVREQGFQPDLPSFRVLAVYKEYILIACEQDVFPDMPEEGLLLIDSREALSRIADEELKAKPAAVVSQMLLVPSFFEFSPTEALAIRNALGELEKLGIAIREFGTNGFLVESLPRILEHGDLEEFLRHVASTSCASLDTRVIFQKTSNLSIDVAEQVVRKLFLCKDPWVSPTGTKTMSLMTKSELKKRFSS